MAGCRSTLKPKRLACLGAALAGLLMQPALGERPAHTSGLFGKALAWSNSGRAQVTDGPDNSESIGPEQFPDVSPASAPPREPSLSAPGWASLADAQHRSVEVSNVQTTVVVTPPKPPARQTASAMMKISIVAPEPPPLPELPSDEVEFEFATDSDDRGILPELAREESTMPDFGDGDAAGTEHIGGQAESGPEFDFATAVQREWPLRPGMDAEPLPADAATSGDTLSSTEAVVLQPSTPPMPGPIAFFEDEGPLPANGTTSADTLPSTEPVVLQSSTPAMPGPIAFLQEQGPLPTPADPTPLGPNPGPEAFTNDVTGPGLTTAPEAADSQNDAVADREEQTLGEAPEDTTLRFLRQQTVLLEPGEFQFDVGFTYLNDEIDFPALSIDVNNNVIVGELTRRQRLLMMPLELRFGITKWAQGFVRVPLGWSNSETVFNGEDQFEDTGILGDISAGITKQVIVGNEFYPDVLFTGALTAPTGDSSFVTSLLQPGAALGQGFWSASANVTFVQSYDPLVLFYGLGYTYRFEEKFGDDIYVDPGQIFSYRFGIGFAVNPHVTLSSTFQGSYIGKNEVNDLEVGGSIQEPLQLRLAATISRRKQSDTHSSVKIIEPFVNFGLNEDAIDAVFGITFTH